MGKSKRNKSRSRLAKRRRCKKRVVERWRRLCYWNDPVKTTPLDVFINAGLLERTLDYCSRQVLGVCMRVSKAMFESASRRLYRHLSYSDDEDPFLGGQLHKPYSKAHCLLHTKSLVLMSHPRRGCGVIVPDHVDILYMDVDESRFCTDKRVCSLVREMDPRVLIIRDLRPLKGKAGFEYFQTGLGIKQVVLYAYDDVSLPLRLVEHFYQALEIVIICKGAPSHTLLKAAAEHGPKPLSSSPSDIYVQPNGENNTYCGVFQGARDLEASAHVDGAEEDPHSVLILPPYVNSLVETICLANADAEPHVRRYTIVDAHLWDPHFRENYDEKGSFAVTRALQAKCDRILESHGLEAHYPFTVQTESEFMDANPEVAGCMDERDAFWRVKQAREALDHAPDHVAI